MLGQRLAIDQFHDQPRDAVGVLDAVNCGDVRMVERSQRPRFPLEAFHAVRIGSDLVRENLYGNTATEPGVANVIHLAHAALADERDDLVVAEAITGTERHRPGFYANEVRAGETQRLVFGLWSLVSGL